MKVARYVLLFGVFLLLCSNPAPLELEEFIQTQQESLSDALVSAQGGGNPWVIDGMIVYNHTSYGEIRVWNHTSIGLTKHIQYANLTSWIPISLDLDFAFEYDSSKMLTKKAWVWRNSSHNVEIKDYGWVAYSHTDWGTVISYNTTHFIYDDPVTLETTIAYDFMNTTGFYWEEWEVIGSHIEVQWWIDWDEITHLFTHAINPLNGLDLQWIKNVNFNTSQTRMIKFEYNTPLRWNYEPSYVDEVGWVGGKWGIWIKRSSDTIQQAWQSKLFVYLDPWWDSDWTYRKSHVINNAAGAGTGYQVKIVTHYGSGSDSVENVYLNSHCETDFGDIRFLDNDNTTELDYWMQEYHAADNATFWVEVQDDLSSSAVTIWLYYGKSEASTTSNGDNTFPLFFDDMEGDMSEWNIVEGTPSVTTDQAYAHSQSMELDSSGGVEKVNKDFGSELTTVAIEYAFYDGNASDTSCDSYNWLKDDGGATMLIGVSAPSPSSTKYQWHNGSWQDCDITRSTGWHRVSIRSEGDGENDIIFDGITVVNDTGTSFGGIRRVYNMHGSGGPVFYYDMFFLREFVEPEPSHGAWGSEESEGDSTAPAFNYDATSTTNNTNIQYNSENALANWSITEVNPDYYFIFSNATGSNATKDSGSYSNGDYVNWTYVNTNISNIGKVVFIEAWANDTSGNSAYSIAYFTVYEETPEWAYDGTSTANNSEVEYGGTILGNWSLTDEDPDDYWIFGNETGSNVTKASGKFTSGNYYSHSFTADNPANLGKTLFIQIVADDDGGYSNASIVYFTIVDTTAPSFVYGGDANNTDLEYGTDFEANWTVTEVFPHYHFIWSNATGANATKESGSYSNGATLDWTYPNTNLTNIGKTLFIQLYANDTSGNSKTSIAYFSIIETVSPTFTYVGTSNNSQVHCGTSIIGNWSISEQIPDKYEIFSNETGTGNVSRISGSYANGDYKSWTFANTNASNAGLTIFMDMHANDTQANHNASTVYFSIVNDVPSWVYTGDTNNTDWEWELDGAFTASWTTTEISPDTYIVYYNATGSNTTLSSGAYTSSVSESYDPPLSKVDYVIFLQLYINDTFGNSNTSIVYFTVVNTNPPTVTIASPLNTTYTQAITVTLTSGNEDADTYWYRIYFSNGTLHLDNTTWMVSTEVSLSAASYYLQAFLNDTAALEDEATVYFTITTALLVEGGPGPPGPPEKEIPIENYVTSPVGRPWVPQVFVALGFCGVIVYFERYPTLQPEKVFLDYKRRVRRQLNVLAMYYQKKQKRRHKR